MIDALLFAVRESVWNAGWGYSASSCDIRVDGKPIPGMGDFFLSIHEAGSQSRMDNALDEYFAFDLTLTQRVTVPLDRIGDPTLAAALARTPGTNKQPSFNARLEQLRAFFHMNWLTLQIANNFIGQWSTETVVQNVDPITIVTIGPSPPYNPVYGGPVAAAAPVYGFCEPARFRGMEKPRFEAGSWFTADDAAEDVGLVASLHFDECRRLQALQMFV